ncbi:hypothetical protein CJ671_08415 [Aliarcobacter cryaerophilus]|uniref:DUF4198 domain-containing protein n=1 Tax=Aliarcobacter cryaerophilus TaxID=28198 RepID=A0A2S9SQC9_9BACT|nr:hypothetical protein [Aliarcobacter cryaerophilus]PRM88788.1 hypothetical protein CJ671_08415 [Aliarcobacter cryaerophilus]
MKKIVYGVLASAIFLSSGTAHEIWIEKDKKNEANIFFGEFADGKKEGAKFLDRLKLDTFYPKDIVKDIKKEDNSVFLTLSKDSDLVLVEVGEPRLNKNTQVTARKISYAKTGRTNTDVLANFDLVPLEKNSNTFKLLFDKKPMPKTKVTVVSPTKWEKSFYTNEQGEVTISTPWIGTYLLEASFEDNTKGELNGKAFDKTIYAITHTIKVEQGLPWETK